GDAGPQVDSQHDGQGGRQGDQPSPRQHQENTADGAAALKHGRQQKTGPHSQKRPPAGGGQQPVNRRGFPQGFQAGGNPLQAHKDQPQPEEGAGAVFPAAVGD